VRELRLTGDEVSNRGSHLHKRIAMTVSDRLPKITKSRQDAAKPTEKVQNRIENPPPGSFGYARHLKS
jgi:hypothetical protein